VREYVCACVLENIHLAYRFEWIYGIYLGKLSASLPFGCATKISLSVYPSVCMNLLENNCDNTELASRYKLQSDGIKIRNM
jgi:hypothetical protein